MDTFDLATHLISTSSGQAFDKPTVQQELEFYALYKQVFFFFVLVNFTGYHWQM